MQREFKPGQKVRHMIGCTGTVVTGRLRRKDGYLLVEDSNRHRDWWCPGSIEEDK